ncbi:DNA-3-methyladenine glycosylase I [Lapidilactobacillus bayanensis]|uniref:DNA-3-methyladenine glycosylase I n=1 Tax=Lapidilactobacillus bayanensis TaxID=2485998 RepID=UPI000F78F6E3|nr:DNA-3-methyladenine glycosylase I [Lapidilactobacillus bayanensis]
MTECTWAQSSPAMQQYHDTEWGKPEHDSQKLFGLLCLETFQAGLSWQTVLNKRAAFEQDFQNFEPHHVAQMTATDVERLMQDPAIIRNRRKIEAAITNAQAVLQLEADGGFGQYLWSFVDDQPLINHPQTDTEVPATSALSERVSKALKQQGFKFVGPTIIYSFLQGAGLINDHVDGCPFK